MNTLGSILVHIDASPRAEARMQLACSLAALSNAGSAAVCEVDAVYGTSPSYLDMPYAYTEGAMASMPLQRDLDEQWRNAARALFERINASATPPMRWQELGGDTLFAAMTRRALYADLLVLGQYDSGPHSRGVPADFVETVLIDSGKPALIVPYAGSFSGVGRDVLVAWKATRESARALFAAIPLLQRAKRIHVVGETAEDADEPGGSRLERCLRLHGIECAIERHATVADEAPGEGLLSLAADVGADLLVMGCYGHSRARELMLGGATRTILKSMTLPVLMAH